MFGKHNSFQMVYFAEVTKGFPGEILRLRREALKLTTRDVGRAAGVSHASIGQYERGDANLGNARSTTLKGIAYALNWTLAELQKETGLDLGLEPVELIGGEGWQGLSVDDHALQMGFHLAPIIGQASAGSPEMYPVPNHVWRRGTQVLEITGHSMTTGDPDSLRDGDWVFVDSNQTQLQDGKVYVIEIIGNGMTVKRARKLNGEWFLMSDNPEYSSLKVDEARIIGNVYDAVGRRRV
jgi:repressor LexA